MTTIAIYGDSYACNLTWMHQEKMQHRKSWVDHLRDSYDVTNYGRPGTNLSFTHDMFMKHNMYYDFNIVLVTHWGRLHLERLPPDHQYVPNLSHLEYMINEHRDPKDLEILNAAKDYFIYVENENEVKKFHRLMVEEIKNVGSTTIVIPCFPKSMSLDSTIGEYSMFDINYIDNKYYKLAPGVTDSKHCHLSDKNNYIFANKINEYLNSYDGTTEFSININDYVEPIGEPVEYNFIV